MGERKRREDAWGPWERGRLPVLTEADIEAHARHTGAPVEEVRRVLADIQRSEAIWVNAAYQVNIRDCGEAPEGWPPLKHLSIKRRDKAPVGKERFRHFQRIKNELVGPECEAVELYPAESRLVDSANQYHLFCFGTPEARWPFGFRDRLVLGGSGAGAVQEPFEDGGPPR